jgi:phage-related protein
MRFEFEYADGLDGTSPFETHLSELDERAKTSKPERVLLKQIFHHFRLVEERGTRTGEPQVKHLKDKIWEMRPGSMRILFAMEGNTVLILHHFYKTTQKTPRREIERAETALKNWQKKG